MDRNVIHQISQQQMKGEKGRCQEKIVHRMQIDLANRRNDEHQKKEKKKRHRRGVANFPRQRPGLQLRGHSHTDLKARNQIRVLPGQLPAAGNELLGSGRERIVGEINLPKIGLHGKHEIARLDNSLSPLVAPTIQTLRAIRNVQVSNFSRPQGRPPHRALIVSSQCNRLIVHLHLQPIVDGLLRGEFQPEIYRLPLRRVVPERIVGSKINRVGAVPQQSLLPWIEMEVHPNAACFHWQKNLPVHGPAVNDHLAVFNRGRVLDIVEKISRRRRRLLLRRAPRRGYAPLQLLIASVSAREDGRTQNHPRNGGTHKDEGQRQNLSQQKNYLLQREIALVCLQGSCRSAVIENTQG